MNNQDESDLDQRIRNAKRTFKKMYGTLPAVISRAPGRAEILGCHTDYNNGFALAAGISRSTLCLAGKRSDKTVTAYSNNYPNNKPNTFPLASIASNADTTWTKYVRAVVNELLQADYKIGGVNILIDSTVPKSGGVSSSAALELAVAFAILRIHKQPIDRTRVALLCKKAENSPIVKSPCGFLDQGASAFAKQDALVLLDFLPKGDSPVSNIKVLPAKFPVPASFIIPVDPTLERQLGETGYVLRRKMCEDSLPFWQSVLHRPIWSLRDVTLAEFLKFRDRLEKKNPVMRKRVEHIITENARVLDAVSALKNNDIVRFGKLLTEAGKSSLELYELDENTPQLTFLVTYGRTLPGVFGMRNMGGGFSAIGLALVKNGSIRSFKQTLSTAYNKRFHRILEFIEFTPGEGAQILYG
jgi:galactokinase